MKNYLSLMVCLMGLLFFQEPVLAQSVSGKKILFVVTSHNQKGDTGETTGYYLSEVTHPWDVLLKAGYEIDFVSPQGGTPPVDALDLKDPVNKAFWNNKKYRSKMDHSLTPAAVNPADYAAIFYAGGHGAMWDFPDNPTLARITMQIYAQGGIVAAVCHGPAALIGLRLENGRYLIQGKEITAFTNEEEQAKKLDHVVPFLLEDALTKHGAKFKKSGLWQARVCVDQRIITGQNPQSARGVGEAIARALRL